MFKIVFKTCLLLRSDQWIRVNSLTELFYDLWKMKICLRPRWSRGLLIKMCVQIPCPSTCSLRLPLN